MKLVPVVILVMALSLLGNSTAAVALPFNTDMSHNSPQTGDVMRPKSPNSIALGTGDRYVASFADAETLKNPTPNSIFSVKSGERLFQINCAPCHGSYSPHYAHTESVISKSWIAPIPNLHTSKVVALDNPKAEGTIYGYIYFGRGLMPAYGWKLSPQQHWDIVSYVRTVQANYKK